MIGAEPSTQRRLFSLVLASYRRTSGTEPDEALHVVNQIGHSDPGGGARAADGSDEQGHRPFHTREWMFDEHADL